MNNPQFLLERNSSKSLKQEISTINNDPVISGLLKTISGLLVVLDQKREIIGLNNSFLKLIGIDDPEEVLGLRLGEAIKCKYANESTHGCGTTKYCSTCGAAIAIIASLESDNIIKKTCELKIENDLQIKNMVLSVHSQPIIIDKNKYLLIFLQDITLEQQRASLERTFFHDINNMVSGLVGLSEVVLRTKTDSVYCDKILKVSRRISNEIEIQRLLMNNEELLYKQTRENITPDIIVDEIKTIFTYHNSAKEKTIIYPDSLPTKKISVDLSILLRVLCNMITNALEATKINGFIKIEIFESDKSINFSVWNNSFIPEKYQLRIFQKNFTTKDESGRGIGTYSMKLLGEEILGGKITFETSEKKGTTFLFSLNF